ncbi:MAG TPA: restriction endonuclease subunit S [Dehalococcoidia bacterium]|nr:restriction endonuclease subunit S [Dehalococcoidia bacterium]
MSLWDEHELPEGWSTCQMGDISDIVGGGTPTASEQSNFSDDGHPWITPADLSDFRGNFIERGRRCLSDRGLNSSSAKLMPPGTVLMSSRAPIGYVAIAANEVCTNQGFKSFVCHENILPEYLLHWLRFIRTDIEQMGSGTTFTEISGSRCKEIPFKVAPLAEQHRIVAKVDELLEKANAVRERLQRVPEILKRFRQSVLAAACSGRLTEDWREEDLDGDDFPALWTLIDAGDIYVDARYGTSKKCQSGWDAIPVLRVPNIARGVLDLADIKSTTLSEREIDSLAVSEGDLIVCRTNGSLDLIGKAAVIPKLECPFAFASYLIRLRLDQSQVLPGYFHAFLSAPIGRDQIEARARSTAGQFNLNLEILRGLQLPVAPIAEQQEIVRRVEALFALADVIEQRVAAGTARAEKLPQAILAKAFRGELVPTEAELATAEGRSYEPASELLEKIKTQKAQAKLAAALVSRKLG